MDGWMDGWMEWLDNLLICYIDNDDGAGYRHGGPYLILLFLSSFFLVF